LRAIFPSSEGRQDMASLAPFRSAARVTTVSCIAPHDEPRRWKCRFWLKHDTFGVNLERMELCACLSDLSNAGDLAPAICESPAAQTLEVLALYGDSHARLESAGSPEGIDSIRGIFLIFLIFFGYEYLGPKTYDPR
jgi:hypothetical protein